VRMGVGGTGSGSCVLADFGTSDLGFDSRRLNCLI
jgi:hypothetical protein